MQKITPFLWFNENAEEALNFYATIFPDSMIKSISRYPNGPMKGKVLTAVFQLHGQEFMAIDGGPMFEFTEAISLFVKCETQQEVDYYWERLLDGGEEQMCGWLKDKFGLSWQIIPTALPALLNDPDPVKAKRAMEAMLQMKKIDIEGLTNAH